MQSPSEVKPLRDYLSSVNHGIPIELLEPFDYVWDKKGKGIRSTLMNAFNVWLQIPKEKLVEVDHVISMLHNASLMYVLVIVRCKFRASSNRVDDIEDNSKLRRGLPVAASIYGVPRYSYLLSYYYYYSYSYYIFFCGYSNWIVRLTLQTIFILFLWRKQ
jgi:geranylgeranyl pyrophosphate synthase